MTGGLSCNGTDWLTVTIDVSNGGIVIENENGTALGLDMANHKDEATAIENIAVRVTGATYDIYVVE